MDNLNIISLAKIQQAVYIIRNQPVMLDSDLAEIYGYKLKVMNQQVRRNITRFPNDFMFQLTPEEIPPSLKSQFVTLNETGNKRGLHIKKMPYVFTEQGIYMLATILHGDLAEQQSIAIMRIFKEMRHYIQQNQQLLTPGEAEKMDVRISCLALQNRELVKRQDITDNKILAIQNSIDALNENFITNEKIKNIVIYQNQKFEADLAFIDIFRQAHKSIYLVDDYVSLKTLEQLSHKKSGVNVVLFTGNKAKKSERLTAHVVADFNEEYPFLHLKENSECHDRYIILDYGYPTEQVYHCGASSKDAGKKVCGINKIDDTKILHPVIKLLLQNPDLTI